MDEVVFCEECHRVLSVEFHFCPYCGHKLSRRPVTENDEPADTPSFEQIVDESLDRVQETAREYTVRRLDELLGELVRLEAELDSMAVTVPPSVEPVGTGSQTSPAVSGEEAT